MAAPNNSSPFYATLGRALEQRGTSVADICPPNDHVARRVLHDYGAMFVGSEKILPPPLCVFSSEEQVTRFQERCHRRGLQLDHGAVYGRGRASSCLLKT